MNSEIIITTEPPPCCFVITLIYRRWNACSAYLLKKTKKIFSFFRLLNISMEFSAVSRGTTATGICVRSRNHTRKTLIPVRFIVSAIINYAWNVRQNDTAGRVSRTRIVDNFHIITMRLTILTAALTGL